MIAIAIDGPSGAGKSTIAKILAKEMGFVYIDTGALYRAIGLVVLEHDADPKSADHAAALLTDLQVNIQFANGEQRVLLNGRDVTGLIRTPEVSMAASAVSAHPVVRAFLLELQRSIARANNCIMDGRDIGTVVLPDAQVKIFLTASAEERARRRYDELREKGMAVDYATVLRELEERDYNDSHRAAAPLKPADGALLADTTGQTLPEAVALLQEILRGALHDTIL